MLLCTCLAESAWQGRQALVTSGPVENGPRKASNLEWSTRAGVSLAANAAGAETTAIISPANIGRQARKGCGWVSMVPPCVFAPARHAAAGDGAVLNRSMYTFRFLNIK